MVNDIFSAAMIALTLLMLALLEPAQSNKHKIWNCLFWLPLCGVVGSIVWALLQQQFDYAVFGVALVIGLVIGFLIDVWLLVRRRNI